MQLRVCEAIIRTNTTEENFFRCAHVFRFGTTGDVTNDLVQWKLHAIVPNYIQDYATYILELP
jgi:hypothetical protein